jgi:hypothetical protein
VPLDDAFLDQRVHNPVHGWTCQAGRLYDLGKRQAGLAPCGQDAQHGNRAAYGLRTFPRFHLERYVHTVVHHVDNIRIIQSTGKGPNSNDAAS